MTQSTTLYNAYISSLKTCLSSLGKGPNNIFRGIMFVFLSLMLDDTIWNPLASVETKFPCMDLPWDVAVVVAVVTGDLPLVWADWLVVETEVLVAGELVGARGPAALVMAPRRPSGFVPYCTGWNNLIRKN